MQGDSVSAVQRFLSERGFLQPEQVDGVFGRDTLAAVRSYQAQNNLEVDGLVGPLTLGSLEVKGWQKAPVAPQRVEAAPLAGQVESATPVAPGSMPAPTQPPVPEQSPQRLSLAQVAASQAAAAKAARERPPSPVSQPKPAAPPSAQAQELFNQAFLSLPQPQQLQLNLIASGQAGAASKAAFDQLVLTPGFSSLDVAGRAKVLASVQPANVRASVAELERLMQLPVFAQASNEDRAKVLDLAGAGQAQALAAFGDALLMKDSQGTRLLDSAHQLATAPLMPELEKDRAALLTAAFTEAADPSRILQGHRGTCSATNLVATVARGNPAEFVRLLAGLASPEGRVTTLTGQTLARAPGSEKGDQSGRSVSQRLFQSAVSDFGNGGREYDNAHDSNVGTFFDTAGLSPAETAKTLTALTGTPHRPRVVEGSLSLFGRLVGLDDADDFTFSKSPDDLFEDLTKQTGETFTSLQWDKTNHSVVVTRIENGRVYFHNPMGNTVPAGGEYLQPPRRSEGGSDQSMTVADFRQRLLAVID